MQDRTLSWTWSIMTKRKPTEAIRGNVRIPSRMSDVHPRKPFVTELRGYETEVSFWNSSQKRLLSPLISKQIFITIEHFSCSSLEVKLASESL